MILTFCFFVNVFTTVAWIATAFGTHISGALFKCKHGTTDMAVESCCCSMLKMSLAVLSLTDEQQFYNLKSFFFSKCIEKTEYTHTTAIQDEGICG